MAYEAGDTILDNEYNSFVGVNGTVSYPSQIAADAAAPCVGIIYGVGYGNRGYGQTGIALSAVTTATPITSAQWTTMRNALAVCSESQSGVVGGSTLIPPITVMEAGDIIQAHESSPPTSDAYDFNSVIQSINTNRFTTDATKSSVVVTSGVSSNVRGSAWGSASGSINCIFDYAFGSEDAARYFSNSGGELRIDLSHPAGSPQDNDWSASLGTRLGQVRIGTGNTSSTGTSGLSSTVGFYDLTDAYQTVIDGTNIGTGAYTTNDVLIEAHRLNFVGTNGGNGDGIRVRITLTDQHTNAFSDLVSAGTTANFSVLKATFLVGIVTPTGSVPSPF